VDSGRFSVFKGGRKQLKITNLQHRISLQKKLITKDLEGIPIESWQDIATVWVAIEPLRGRKYFQAATVQSQHDPIHHPLSQRNHLDDAYPL
jgi:SPP1 family predicted phage head-tail adaptor